MGGYEVEFQDAHLRVATADNMQLASWFDAPEMEHMQTIDRIYKGLKRRAEGGVVFTNVVVGGVPRFTPEIREEAARQTADVDDLDLATCHLILVDGMVGSAVRMFMSTTMLIGRPPHPTKVFGDIGGAARWLAIQLGKNGAYSWSESRLQQVLTEAARPLS